MKPVKTDTQFSNAMKKELELAYMPQQVTRKLQQLYFELPDPLYAARRPSRLRAVCASLSAVAAAVLLLLGLNAVNPAFAEEIPLIGNIFRQINTGGHDADTVDTERLAQHAAEPGTESSHTLTAQNDAYAVTVESVYYDGKFLHSALKLTADIDIRESGYRFSAAILLNGELVFTPAGNDSEYTQALPTPYIQWISTGNGSYVGDLMFPVPEKYQTGKPLQVAYNFTLQDMTGYSEKLVQAGEENSLKDSEQPKPTELGQNGTSTVRFEAVPDSAEAIHLPITCESQGAVISDFYTSPAGTEIAVRVPNESDYGAYAKLYTEDGKEIHQLSPESTRIMADSKAGFIDALFAFNGLKKAYTRVVLQVYIHEDDDDQSIYRIAEFTIDTENHSITATEKHKDKNSILYSNFALRSIRPSFHPTYRAPDAALSLSSGYQVEYLSSGGLHKSAYLTFVTPDSYRDLRVELYVNDQLRTVETTKQGSPDENNFMPLKDYVYDPDGICTLEDGTVMFLDSGNILRPEEIKAHLNIQSLSMGDVFFQMDDVVTVKIYDAASGQMLHTETQTLTLPENAKMPEGYRMYKQPSLSAYVFANPDDLP